MTTHILEFDFRYSWIQEVLRGLDHAIESRDRFDGMDQMETGEAILGIGFIALQAYIAGTVSDLKEIFSPTEKPHDLRAMSPLVGSTCVPLVEAIWAVANYYKHHDEWPDWQPKGPRAPTIDTLKNLGVDESTEFPCIEIIKLLLSPHWHLLPLMEAVSAWREELLEVMRRRCP